MSKEPLHHSQSYEWFGTFWLPNTQDKELSGKLKYTPEHGIILELLEFFDDESLKEMFDEYERACKLVHGVIVGKNRHRNITVINTMLYKVSASSSSRITRGPSQMIVFDAFLREMNTNNFVVEYGTMFEAAFVSPLDRSTHIMQYTKGKPIKIKGGIEISWKEYPLSFDSDSNFKKIDDIDKIFWSRTDKKNKKIKKAFEGMNIKPFEYNLLDRKEITSKIWFSKNNKSIEEFVRLEKQWRLFWELLVQSPIAIDRAWMEVEKKAMVPAIIWQGHIEEKRVKNINELPISFHNLSKENLNLKAISSIIRKWIKINENPDWQFVINRIRHTVKPQKKLFNKQEYIPLHFELKTLMNLLKFPDEGENITNFIECYASEKWKKEMIKIFSSITSSELKTKPHSYQIASHIKRIRANIVHPIGTKDREKYAPIIQDETNIQDVYAYIAGIFIKAVLKHVTKLGDKVLDKFMHAFIDTISGWHEIEYK